MSDDAPQKPYDRAVALVKARPSVSARNLETTLGLSPATAKSFLRIMREEGIISAPMGNLGRHAVLSYTPPEGGGLPSIDVDNPENSVLYGQDLPVDDILSAEAQKRLRVIVDYIIAEEDKAAVIREGIAHAYKTAKQLGLVREALKPVIKAIRKDNVSGLVTTVNAIEVYLHALGQLIEDAPGGPSAFQGGGGSGTKH
ncbi:hypothetical protein AEAC466_17230 [Asticcacaulis sp. AC466]|uniref:hypothetical protein n=1 Tax=Asticcacaulis sp. AC466 TaxID=1282362 RepID=UPI0003C3D7AE|nr:hypothetical protein [Asticcacaulis sp. AC466]ESQ82366.1 hypothetical protein AEAC466_17230 [Asticcacaulis sp. AC466]